MRTRGGAFVVAGLALLAAAGCGGSGGAATSESAIAATTSSPSSVASTTTTTSRRVSDTRLATKGLLVLDDLPTGWQSRPEAPHTEADIKRIAACLHVDASRVDSHAVPHASFHFWRNDKQATGQHRQLDTIDGGVSVFPSAAAATAFIDLVGSPRYAQCTGAMVNPPLHPHVITLTGVGNRAVDQRIDLVGGTIDGFTARQGRSICWITTFLANGVSGPALLSKMTQRMSDTP